MSEKLIDETLKRMQDTLALHTQNRLETKERLGFLEQQYARISGRVAPLCERLERVEKRHDLADV